MIIELIIQSVNNSKLTLIAAPFSYEELVAIVKQYFNTNSNAFSYMDDHDLILVKCQYDYLQAISFARKIKRNCLTLTICDTYLMSNHSEIALSNKETIFDQQILISGQEKDSNKCKRIDDQYSTVTENKKLKEAKVAKVVSDVMNVKENKTLIKQNIIKEKREEKKISQLDQLKHNTAYKIKKAIEEQMTILCNEIIKQQIQESNAVIDKAYCENKLKFNCKDSIENIFFECSDCKRRIKCEKCEDKITFEDSNYPLFKLKSSSKIVNNKISSVVKENHMNKINLRYNQEE